MHRLLERGNDPFYTPLLTRTLEPVLVACLPSLEVDIVTTMKTLREHLVYLVAANTSAEQKRVAHDAALRIFRDLRGGFGAGT